MASKNQPNQQFPRCTKKNEARMVCLHKQCKQYPFFCTHCQEGQCRGPHHHGDKMTSVSFKQFIQRVLKDRKPPQSMDEAAKKYRECLEKLRKDVNQFVEKEIKELDDLLKKAVQIPQEQAKIIQKLRAKQYQGLKGLQLDKLWDTVCQLDKKTTDNELVEFLNNKLEEVNVISENFEAVNQMKLEDFRQDENPGKSDKKDKANNNKNSKNNENSQKNQFV